MLVLTLCALMCCCCFLAMARKFAAMWHERRWIAAGGELARPLLDEEDGEEQAHEVSFYAGFWLFVGRGAVPYVNAVPCVNAACPNCPQGYGFEQKCGGRHWYVSSQVLVKLIRSGVTRNWSQGPILSKLPDECQFLAVWSTAGNFVGWHRLLFFRLGFAYRTPYSRSHLESKH